MSLLRRCSQQAVSLAASCCCWGPHEAAALPSRRTGRQRCSCQRLDAKFAALGVSALTMLADLSWQPVRGLSACKDLCKDQVVLLLPHSNALIVPEHGTNVYRWECDVAELFEAAHGPLPSALAFFIADTEQPATVRLVAWLLHQRNTCRQQRLRTMWHSWFALLPSLAECTSPGSWAGSELQQLQLQPLQTVLATDNTAYQAYAAALHTTLPQYLPGLQGNSVSDVLWALLVVKTRSVSSPGHLALYPVHDMLNHAEAPNCSTAFSSQGLSVTALRTIAAGEELSINYAPPAGISNLGFLTSWGFSSQVIQPQDIALPLIVHALPPLSWRLAVSAAGAAAAAAGEVERLPSLLAGQRQPEPRQAVLTAALGCLPVSYPEASGISSRQPRGRAAGGAHALLYAAAVQLIQHHGCCSTSRLHVALQAADEALLQQLQQQVQQQQQGQLSGMANVGGSALQGSCALQAYKHPDEYRRFPMAALQMQLQLQQCDLHATTAQLDVSAEELSLQGAVSAALYNECQSVLLQCSTTAEQDEALLVLLQEMQQDDGAKPGFSEAAAADPQTVAALAAAAAAQQAQQQELLQEFLQLQEHVMRQLMALQAAQLCQAGNQSSKAAAQALLQALQQQQQQQRVLKQVQLAQQRQQDILQLLLCECNAGGPDAGSVVLELLAPPDAHRVRLITAVTARLQQKQLLLATAHICREAARLCAA